MASTATAYTTNLCLQWLLTNNTVTRPTSYYCALYTATGEVVSYDRLLITFNVVNDIATNANDIIFTAASDYGTITHIGVFDSLTNGNLLFYGPAYIDQVIYVGDKYRIQSGNMTVNLK